jgi:hypothetical protein
MTIKFRTDDTGRTGYETGIGRNLYPGEVDGNFWDLLSRIIDLETDPAAGVGIDSITVSGSQMTVHLTDATTQGPFTLPTSSPRLRGAWAASTAYYKWDIVTVAGLGAFFVVQNHTSAATFDPDAGNTDGDFYQAIYADPGSAPVNTITSSSITLGPSHVGKFNLCTIGCSVTVVSGSLSANQEAHFCQDGTDQVEMLDGDTATIIKPYDGYLFKTAGRGAVLTIKCIGDGIYRVFGHLAPDASA